MAMPVPGIVAAPQPSSLQEKGLLHGVQPHEVVQRGIDLFRPELSVEDLWGASPPTGAAFLEAVLSFYGDGVHDVPWFFQSAGDGENVSSGLARSIVRSPLSREIQEATVQNYKERIFRESISQVAAGFLLTSI